jgi:hypothetical protein
VTEQDRRTVSRLGTARALVLLASVLAFAISVLVCIAALAVGPAILKELAGTAILASVVFCLVVLVSAIAASLLAVRATTVRGVLGRGFGILLAGVVAGLAVTLLLLSNK